MGNLTGADVTTGIFRISVPTADIPFSSERTPERRLLFEVDGVKSEVEEFLPELPTSEFCRFAGVC